MFKKFSFWLKGSAICQLVTGLMHAIGLFITLPPTNDTEKQLMYLLDNYHMDMGGGFHPTFGDLFLSLSASFTLLCLFGSFLNFYLYSKQLANSIWKGLLLIQIIIFGILFFVMLRFAFLPPIVTTGLIFLFLLGAFWKVNAKS